MLAITKSVDHKNKAARFPIEAFGNDEIRSALKRFFNRSAIAQQCSAAPLGCEASKFSAAYLCCKFPATFGHNSRCGSTLRNWGRSEMMVTQLVFVSFPQFRYITDDDDATRSASN